MASDMTTTTEALMALADREAFEEFHGPRRSKGAAWRERKFARRPDGTYVDDSVQRHWWTWQNARAGLAEVVRDAERWRQPGPVTAEHPLECLVVLPSLRQSDGDWWTRGGSFMAEGDVLAWMPDTPETRAALAARGAEQKGV